ncbi:MAG: pyrroloquinoline quinone biosynthesis protein PqqB [Oscillatoriaceae cyanobacterium Prado104]|jgi:pyrroloquinoline quinone biosynthesis protein B|nr:pyrroloquinoline quinone biosynthesis protein PqqB [Oscillatoriaceae cyanobacterium Prado104]
MTIVRILGAAAGGGFPQWNCHCQGCETSRSGGVRALTQSSIAIRSNGGDWFLINASPDVRQQIELMRADNCFPPQNNNCFAPQNGRSVPFAGIILTDAEIDHTTGLILLRESSQPLKIYSPDRVKFALTTGYPLLSTLQNYCGVDWSPLDAAISLSSDLEVESFALSSKPPKYMQDATRSPDEVWGVGLTIRDRSTGKTLTYAPGLAEIDEAMQRRLNASDCILIDGTFWTNDELPALGVSSRSARQMGHLPLSGEGGSLQELARLTTPRKMLVHINNTNPILIPNSAQQQAVGIQGVEIGCDGLMFEL